MVFLWCLYGVFTPKRFTLSFVVRGQDPALRTESSCLDGLARVDLHLILSVVSLVWMGYDDTLHEDLL